mgnify:CR=1 FL=1
MTKSHTTVVPFALALAYVAVLAFWSATLVFGWALLHDGGEVIGCA